jgi:hypothetical protein
MNHQETRMLSSAGSPELMCTLRIKEGKYIHLDLRLQTCPPHITCTKMDYKLGRNMSQLGASTLRTTHVEVLDTVKGVTLSSSSSETKGES